MRMKLHYHVLLRAEASYEKTPTESQLVSFIIYYAFFLLIVQKNRWQ